MAEAITIAAEARTGAGKGVARAARRAGKIPGVIYGGKQEPVLINIDRVVMGRLLRDPGFTTRMCEITLGEERHRVLPRAVQVHAVSEAAIHLDFMRVGAQTEITVPVPVRFVNDDQSPGLKRGGVLNVVRYEIELVCRADAIPDHLTVDLAGVDLGDSVHISAIALPEGVRPAITDRDFTVATIAAPSGLRPEGGAVPGAS